MLAELIAVTRHPHRTAGRGSIRLGPPLATVFLLAVLAVAGTLVPAIAVSDFEFPSSPPISIATGGGTVEAPSLSIGLVALALVTPFLAWALVSLVVHLFVGAGVLAATAVGDGNPHVPTDRAGAAAWGARRWRAFVGTVAALGWGYVPQVAATAVSVALLLTVLAVRPVDSPVGVNITLATHATISIRGLPLVTDATHLIGGLCTVWTGYVWTGTLQAYRGVSRRLALAVVVPVTLALVSVSDAIGYFGLVG